MANKEVGSVSVKVILDQSEFNTGIKTVTNELNTLKESFGDLTNVDTPNFHALTTELSKIKDNLSSLGTFDKSGFERLITIFTEASSKSNDLGNKLVKSGDKAKTSFEGMSSTLTQAESKANNIANLLQEAATYMERASNMNLIVPDLAEELGMQKNILTVIEEKKALAEAYSNITGTIPSKMTEELRIGEEITNIIERICTGEASETGEIQKQISSLSEKLALLNEESTLYERNRSSMSLIVADLAEELGMQTNTLRVIQEKLALAEAYASITGQVAPLASEELSLEREIMSIIESISSGEAKETAEIETQLSLLTEKLALLREVDAASYANASTTATTTTGSSKRSKARSGNAKNKLDTSDYLGNRVGSMFATMLMFNEAMDVFEKTTEHSNAVEQLKYFENRLGMTEQQVASYNNELQNLQQTYSKVDMTQVGASVAEAATKYGIEVKDLGLATETYAVAASAFTKEGRTQEDSILAVNDALDGEFRRLKELGISQETLKNNGWSGDINDKTTLLQALNKTLADMGYAQTAKDITSFGDALEAAKIKLSVFLGELFEIVKPVVSESLIIFGKALDLIIDALNRLKSLGNGLPDGVKEFFTHLLSFGLVGGVFVAIGYKIIKTIASIGQTIGNVGGKIKDVFGKLGTIFGKNGDATSKDKTDPTSTETEVDKNVKLSSGLKKLGNKFLKAGVAIAGAFLLIGEVIVGLYAVTWGFARYGELYQTEQDNIQSGATALRTFVTILSENLDLIAVSLALIVGSQFTNVESMARAGLKAAVAIGIAFGLVAEIIAMLSLSLLALALVGATYDWQNTNIDNGLIAMDVIGQVIEKFKEHWVVFAGIIIGGAVLFTTGTVLPAIMSIATGMAVFAAGIALLIPPIIAIGALGWVKDAIGDTNIESGIEAINYVSSALTSVVNAIGSFINTVLINATSILTNAGTLIITAATTLTNIANAFPQLVNAINLIKQTLGADGIINTLKNTGTEVVEDVGLSAMIISLTSTIQAITLFAYSIQGLNLEGIGETITNVATQLTSVSTALPLLISAVDSIKQTLGADGILNSLINGVTEGVEGGSLTTQLSMLQLEIQTILSFSTSFGEVTSDGGAGILAVATQVNTTASAISQIKTAIDNVKSVLGVGTGAEGIAGAIATALGNMGVNIGTQDDGSSLDTALETLKTEAQKILNFGNTLNVEGSGSAGAVQEASNAIAQLQAIVSNFIGQVGGWTSQLHSAGVAMGQAFGSGLSGQVGTAQSAGVALGQAGVSGVNSKQSAMRQAGTNLGNNLKSGFQTASNGLSSTASSVVQKAIDTINSKQSAMRTAGENLGRAFSEGYASTAKATTTTAAGGDIEDEMDYLLSLTADMGETGKRLRQALLSGGDTEAIKTEISELRKSSVNSDKGETLNIQYPSTDNSDNSTTNVNIDLSGSTILGVDNLEDTIRQVATNVFVDFNSVNINTGL